MKITRRQLKQIISESLNEAPIPPVLTLPGGIIGGPGMGGGGVPASRRTSDGGVKYAMPPEVTTAQHMAAAKGILSATEVRFLVQILAGFNIFTALASDGADFGEAAYHGDLVGMGLALLGIIPGVSEYRKVKNAPDMLRTRRGMSSQSGSLKFGGNKKKYQKNSKEVAAKLKKKDPQKYKELEKVVGALEDLQDDVKKLNPTQREQKIAALQARMKGGKKFDKDDHINILAGKPPGQWTPYEAIEWGRAALTRIEADKMIKSAEYSFKSAGSKIKKLRKTTKKYVDLSKRSSSITVKSLQKSLIDQYVQLQRNLVYYGKQMDKDQLHALVQTINSDLRKIEGHAYSTFMKANNEFLTQLGKQPIPDKIDSAFRQYPTEYGVVSKIRAEEYQDHLTQMILNDDLATYNKRGAAAKAKLKEIGGDELVKSFEKNIMAHENSRTLTAHLEQFKDVERAVGDTGTMIIDPDIIPSPGLAFDTQPSSGANRTRPRSDWYDAIMLDIDFKK